MSTSTCFGNAAVMANRIFSFNSFFFFIAFICSYISASVCERTITIIVTGIATWQEIKDKQSQHLNIHSAINEFPLPQLWDVCFMCCIRHKQRCFYGISWSQEDDPKRESWTFELFFWSEVISWQSTLNTRIQTFLLGCSSLSFLSHPQGKMSTLYTRHWIKYQQMGSEVPLQFPDLMGRPPSNLLRRSRQFAQESPSWHTQLTFLHW